MNPDLTFGGKAGERDLIGGGFLVRSVFFAARLRDRRLLLWSGWSPLEASGYAYSALAIAFIVGAFAL